MSLSCSTSILNSLSEITLLRRGRAQLAKKKINRKQRSKSK